MCRAWAAIARITCQTTGPDEFADKNIAFTMFNSNIQDNLPRIAKEAGEFGIDFPIMKDEGST